MGGQKVGWGTRRGIEEEKRRMGGGWGRMQEWGGDGEDSAALNDHLLRARWRGTN